MSLITKNKKIGYQFIPTILRIRDILNKKTNIKNTKEKLQMLKISLHRTESILNIKKKVLLYFLDYIIENDH